MRLQRLSQIVFDSLIKDAGSSILGSEPKPAGEVVQEVQIVQPLRVIDYAKDKRIVAIEVLDASKRTNLTAFISNKPFLTPAQGRALSTSN